MHLEIAKEMCLDIAQESLCAEIYKQTAADQEQAKPATQCGADFVRACAVETHLDISQEPSYAEIYGQKAYRKNSSVWTHGLGNNNGKSVWYSYLYFFLNLFPSSLWSSGSCFMDWSINDHHSHPWPNSRSATSMSPELLRHLEMSMFR